MALYTLQTQPSRKTLLFRWHTNTVEAAVMAKKVPAILPVIAYPNDAKQQAIKLEIYAKTAKIRLELRRIRSIPTLASKLKQLELCGLGFFRR